MVISKKVLTFVNMITYVKLPIIIYDEKEVANYLNEEESDLQERRSPNPHVGECYLPIEDLRGCMFYSTVLPGYDTIEESVAMELHTKDGRTYLVGMLSRDFAALLVKLGLISTIE